MPSDPVDHLLAEHADGYRRFDALESALAGEDATRMLAVTRETLTYLDDSLELHVQKEEGPLFPPLKAALPADDRLIEEMVAEHDQIRLKRDDLRGAVEEILSGDDHVEVQQGREQLRSALAAAERGHNAEAIAALRAAGRAVLRTARIHFQNEEELVFPLVPQLLTAEQRAAAGQEMITLDQEHRAMTTPQDRDRPPGQTTGSPQRPAQRLAGAVLDFDLSAEIEGLHQETAWQQGDRNAKTLVHAPDFRIVLTALKQGTRLARHQAAGRTSIQVLSGRLRIRAGETTIEHGAGGMLVLEQQVPHDVEAIEGSAFLLTIAWPDTAAGA
jgi:quercetin dioxygenase-like cupin family protein/iron-sulfur cluster repair protein YtfE (RIC family)